MDTLSESACMISTVVLPCSAQCATVQCIKISLYVNTAAAAGAVPEPEVAGESEVSLPEWSQRGVGAICACVSCCLTHFLMDIQVSSGLLEGATEDGQSSEDQGAAA